MGASDRKVAALEERCAVVLPADFRNYLSKAAPKGDQWDRHSTEWWEIDRIRSVAEECPDQDWGEISGDAQRSLVFADYMVWCWAWAIVCGGPNDGRVFVIGGGEHNRAVANSFAEFVERYIAGDFLGPTKAP